MLDLVIPDTGPLITFGLIDRMDLIDRFKCPVLITDMVKDGVLRGPPTSPDIAVLGRWMASSSNRIQTVDSALSGKLRF